MDKLNSSQDRRVGLYDETMALVQELALEDDGRIIPPVEAHDGWALLVIEDGRPCVVPVPAGRIDAIYKQADGAWQTLRVDP